MLGRAPVTRPPRRAVIVLMAAAAWACSGGAGRASPPNEGDAQRGRAAIVRYGCAACHVIPGVPGHGANLGPPLVHLAQRGYIGGALPNTAPNMVRWLLDPPGVNPRTAMPNLGLTPAEARDIAAYLYAKP